MPGFVPNVTMGASPVMSSVISLSNAHPSSPGSARHRSSARSHAAPRGANSLPAMYSNVLSSGATMPARAPPSMDILQSVILSSMPSARVTGPAYSLTAPSGPMSMT
jgi:hypothetical protein